MYDIVYHFYCQSVGAYALNYRIAETHSDMLMVLPRDESRTETIH